MRLRGTVTYRILGIPFRFRVDREITLPATVCGHRTESPMPIANRVERWYGWLEPDLVIEP